MGQISGLYRLIYICLHVFVYTVSYYCPIGLLLGLCKESFQRKLCHPLFGMLVPFALSACAAQSTATSLLRLLLPFYRLTQFLDTYFYIVEFSYRFVSFFAVINSFWFCSLIFCGFVLSTSFPQLESFLQKALGYI